MVMVGNNCETLKKREVEQSEGQEVANRYNCPFLEVSTKQQINIDETFYRLIEEIWRKTGFSPVAAPIPTPTPRCTLF